MGSDNFCRPIRCALGHSYGQLFRLVLFMDMFTSVENYINQYKWNEDLMRDLEEDYEIVYPFQIRDRSRVGIDTKNHFFQNLSVHFEKCNFVIKSSYGRFRLNMEQNDNLVPDQARFKFHVNETTQFTLQGKTIDHCFYQGVVHGEDDSKVTLSTCHGLLGAVTVNNLTYFIVPMKGGDLGKRHPHMLIKAKWRQKLACANSGSTEWSNNFPVEHSASKRHAKRDVSTDTKYIELALVIDYDTFVYMDLDFKLLTQFLVESINGVDLIFKHSFETRISLVYTEIWMYKSKNFLSLSDDVTQSLFNFIDFSSKNLYDEPKDVSLLITANKFSRQEISMAANGNVCSSKSVGILRIVNRFQTFRLSVQMSHNIAHILGVRHDEDIKSGGTATCECLKRNGCLMNGKSISGKRNRFSTEFSQCSLDDFTNILKSGRASCLFNKPLQESQLILCGNKKVDPGEMCDCGSAEECDFVDPCCDPITCTLKKGSECGAGGCCDNCKIITSLKICRRSVGDCDVPEFCNGTFGQCPADAHKIDGTECGVQSDGYCYFGQCRTLNEQCKVLWGPDAKVAEKECFEKMNTAKLEPGVAKTVGNSICSSIQCRDGWEIPTLPHYSKTEFAEHKKTFECKTASSGNKSTVAENDGLVKDGTKCLQNRICVDSLCVHLSAITVDPKCPSNHVAWPCSGHGVCTNLHWCYCNSGWSGDDCSVKSPDEISTTTSFFYSTPTTVTQHNANLTKSFSPSVFNSSSSPENSFTSSLLRLDTYAMLVILGAVAGGVLLLLLVLALCYRRKTTSKSRKKKRTDKMQTLNRTLERRHSESSIETAHRSIRFGDMPSYRDEKFQQERKRQHDRLLARAHFLDSDPKSRDVDEMNDSNVSCDSMGPMDPVMVADSYGTDRKPYSADEEPCVADNKLYDADPERYDRAAPYVYHGDREPCDANRVPYDADRSHKSLYREQYGADTDRYEMADPRQCPYPSNLDPRPSPASSRAGHSDVDPYGKYAARSILKNGGSTHPIHSARHNQSMQRKTCNNDPYAVTASRNPHFRNFATNRPGPQGGLPAHRRSAANTDDEGSAVGPTPSLPPARYYDDDSDVVGGALALSLRTLDACDLRNNADAFNLCKNSCLPPEKSRVSTPVRKQIGGGSDCGKEFSKESDQGSPLHLAQPEPLKLDNIEYLLRHLNQQQTLNDQSNSSSLSSSNDPNESDLLPSRDQKIDNLFPQAAALIGQDYGRSVVPASRGYCSSVPVQPGPTNGTLPGTIVGPPQVNNLNIAQCYAPPTADNFRPLQQQQRRPVGWPVGAASPASPRWVPYPFNNITASSSPSPADVTTSSSLATPPFAQRNNTTVLMATPPFARCNNATSRDFSMMSSTPTANLMTSLPPSTIKNVTPSSPSSVRHHMRQDVGTPLTTDPHSAAASICASCRLPTPSASSCDGRASSDGSCDNNTCACKLTNQNTTLTRYS